MKRPRVAWTPDRTQVHTTFIQLIKTIKSVCRNRFNSDNFCEIDRDCLLNLNKTFNVLTLNCCGIRTTLNYPEFHELSK